VSDDSDIANLWHEFLALYSIVVSAAQPDKQKGLQVRTCSPRVRFREELQVHPKVQEYHSIRLLGSETLRPNALIIRSLSLIG
jgi:hypothetical protein